jgi:hypothetical protein
VASDWNFADFAHWRSQRSVVWKLVIREVAKQSWPLEPEDTWRAIGISLTCTLEESKGYDTGTRDMRSREMIWTVGSPKFWTVDLASEALECLARGHSQGHIVEGWRKELVQLSSISEITTWESRDTSYQDPRNRESRSTFWISIWSPPVVTRREGASS